MSSYDNMQVESLYYFFTKPLTKQCAKEITMAKNKKRHHGFFKIKNKEVKKQKSKYEKSK